MDCASHPRLFIGREDIQTLRMLLPSGRDQDFTPDWLWKSTARSWNAYGASTAYCI